MEEKDRNTKWIVIQMPDAGIDGPMMREPLEDAEVWTTETRMETGKPFWAIALTCVIAFAVMMIAPQIIIAVFGLPHGGAVEIAIYLPFVAVTLGVINAEMRKV